MATSSDMDPSAYGEIQRAASHLDVVSLVRQEVPDLNPNGSWEMNELERFDSLMKVAAAHNLSFEQAIQSVALAADMLRWAEQEVSE